MRVEDLAILLLRLVVISDKICNRTAPCVPTMINEFLIMFLISDSMMACTHPILDCFTAAPPRGRTDRLYLRTCTCRVDLVTCVPVDLLWWFRPATLVVP